MLLKLPELGIFRSMSQHPVSCILVQPREPTSRVLESSLRRAAPRLSLRQVQHINELAKKLNELPALLLWNRALPDEQEHQLLSLIQQRSPDTILVKTSTTHWEPLEKRLLEVEVCTVALTNESLADQQLDYLLNYANLKRSFRHSKQLLRLSELRCQWLVDQSREPVAFLVQGKHVHLNVPYLTLFGAEHETELLHQPFAALVQQGELGIFQSLLKSAEQSIQPSNKVLLTLYQKSGEPFRAEVRFIPAVFRHQRAVQVYIHPLDHQLDLKTRLVRPDSDPWQTPATLNASPKVAAVSKPILPTQPSAPVAPAPVKPVLAPPSQADKKGLSLHGRFRETLTVRAGEPALLLAEPYLQTGTGKKVAYAQLKQYAERENNRRRLDNWTLRQAMARAMLPAKAGNDANILVWVELGEWFLAEPNHAAEYLRHLQQQPLLAMRLILSVRLDAFLKYEGTAIRILPLLKKVGSQLALEATPAISQPSLERAKKLGVSFVRLALDSAQVAAWAKTNVRDTTLQTLLTQLNSLGLKVVAEDLADIASMNWLCQSPLHYLAGGVLDRFRQAA